MMAKKRENRSGHSSPGQRDGDATASPSSTTPGSQVANVSVNGQKQRERGTRRKKHHRNEVSTTATPTLAEEASQDSRHDHRQDKMAAAQAEQNQALSRDESAGRKTAATKNSIPGGTNGTDEAAPFAAAAASDSASGAFRGEERGSLGNVLHEDAPPPNPATKSNSQSTIQAIVVCVALFFLTLLLTKNYLPMRALPIKSSLVVESVCHTNECLEYSNQLQRSLSTKADPCYNFYRYVCDPQGDTRPRESKSLLTLTRERLKMRILRSWLDGSDDAITPGSVGEKSLRAGSLFRSCVLGNRFRSFSSDGMFELIALMKERGLTWPHAPQSTPSAEELLDVLIDWALSWNVDVWFSLRVFLVDKVDRRVLFRISRSSILRRWSKERAVLEGAGEYLAFVTAYAREFGANNSGEIVRAVHDVLETEQEIESIFAEYEIGSVIARSGFEETEAEVERWRNAVRRYLGPSAYNATNQDIVFVTSQGLFAAVAILLSRVDKKENYYSAIGWTVAREMGRLVSSSLRALHSMTSAEMVLWCWSRMDKVTKSALVEPFYESTLLGRAMATATQMFRILRGTVSLALAENSWMDKREKEIAFSKIATVSLSHSSSRGFAPRVPRASQLRDKNETFFATWKRAFMVYQKLPLEAKANVHSRELLARNAAFDGKESVVRLQPTLLQMPFYADTLSATLQYAGLGYVIVNQLLHVLSNVFPIIDQDPQSPDEHNEKYDQRVQCLRDLHRQESVSFGHAFGGHNHTDWFCDFAAVPHLYDVVFGPRAVPLHGLERLAGLEELSPEQLFFVGICATLCSDRDFDSNPAPAEARCNVPLMHMPEFQRVFQCPAGLPMTPAVRCSFW